MDRLLQFINASLKQERFKLWSGQNGSVSVYLIVATAGILLLTTVLIDYARIAAFQKQIEIAAQSGIRSSLSAYEGGLYDQYALFGTGGSDRGELFKHSAANNLRSAKDKSFQLLQIDLLSSHVDSYEVLGTHSVFNRQVLEEMKYKAPIDFTMEVASRFAPISSAMKEASTAVDVLEKVRKLYDQRESQLQTVLDYQRDSAKAAEEVENSGNGLAGMISTYNSYLAWRNHDVSLKEGEKALYINEIAAYERNVRTASAELSNKVESASSFHQKLDSKAVAALQDAEIYNADMRVIIQQMKQKQTGTGYDRVNNQQLDTGTTAAVSANDLTQMDQTKQAVEQLLLSPEWFLDYRKELAEQTAKFQTLQTEASSFQSSMLMALSNQASIQQLNEGSNRLRNVYNAYAYPYIQPAAIIKARANELSGRQSFDAERKKKEQEAKVKWGQVSSLLQSMKAVPQKEEHQKEFDEVKKRYETNLHFNQLLKEGELTEEEGGSTDSNGDINEEAEASMSKMGTIFTGMADMLEDIRDPLYMNEYIVHRFTTFDPSKFKAMMQGSDSSEFKDALSLHNQEVEYLLYGLHSPAANVSAAYGEIFAFRLAVRTMEGLVECRALGHPLLVLAASILYGLEKAMEDMLSLAQKGSTPLSKYVRVDVTYLDYLRIFLLLHGSSERRMARAIAVIEQNRGITLTQTSTGLSGELTASVNLWFLPGLMKSFTRFGILKGKVKGNRYETTKTIGWSYG
ncbi:hypothetical protein Back11_61190 [Paenibacillus baekrokdamisoli]|uniref:Uncharacterized protein n=1 Tax=Paenibacillus baekrokdamisoli TaxID=1712516 RepID=A0A3G9JPK0_9BACL|nr:hypothetical protein [Paenibacillus baekrokdamisoli]MBB3072191.1 hypothetical protein [Paenibacillus baekrokdamisoli]BBH24774.1 hypothetical protein Back11_61190 [Paenibacillus baekrokdamisoli]